MREDVPAVEQARCWRRLMEAKRLTQRELAEKLGYDHATIARSLGLLNLPESIQAGVDAGEIRPQTGYELSRIEDPQEQAHLAGEAKAGRLKRDDLRQRVKESKAVKVRVTKAKGRGASLALPKLSNEHALRLDGGFKVVVSGRKGFDIATRARLLKEALDQSLAILEPVGQGEETT